MRGEVRGGRVRWRAGRRTNRALGWLLVGCLITGLGVFASGPGLAARLVVAAHGLVGLGVVALVPWKRVIVVRSRRSLVLGIALAVVVVITVLSGLWQTVLGFTHPFVLTPIQVHVGAAVLIIPLLVVHVLRRRRFHRRPIDPSRRDLLRGAGAAGAVAVGFVASAGAAVVVGAQPRVSTGSRRLAPEQVPATIWLFDRVPVIDPVDHRVDVAGVSMSVEDLARDAEQIVARLDCTSGWFADVAWTGRRLSDLIDPERLAGASRIVVTSVTGYQRAFSASAASTLVLAVGTDGLALSAAGGAPVRLVAPGRRGFWWVKWVASVRLDDRPSWAQSPFPLH